MAGCTCRQSWPVFSAAELRALRGLPYPELAARVMAPFVGDAITFADLQAMCRRAYAGFTHPAMVPLVQLDTDLFALELFHGPTLAFKDLALQLPGICSSMCWRSADERVTHRRRHLRRYRLGRHRGDGRARRRSTSPSCTRRAAPARCSAGR